MTRSPGGHAEGWADRHYFDSTMGSQAVKILPNEFYVSGEDTMLTTVLGSCVAACVRDTVAKVGGMNHFMLPGTDDPSAPASASMRYGAYAMEVLINELLKSGARRERLEAKVFGGGAVLDQMKQMNIGERNADFVLRYLQTEQIPVVAQDLRGEHARRVNFFPRSGKVLVRKMQSHHRGETIVAQREQALSRTLAVEPARPRVELFIKPPVGRKP
jgi:chemotaxis protein CheD